MSAKVFDAEKAMKTYRNDQVSVLVWQVPWGCPEIYPNLCEALDRVKYDPNHGTVAYEIHVHHDGHTIEIKGRDLEELLAIID